MSTKQRSRWVCQPIGLQPKDGQKARRWFAVVGVLVVLWSWVGWRPAARRAVPAMSNPAQAGGTSPAVRVPVKDHERTDANGKWVFGVVLLLGLFGLAIQGILGGFLSRLTHSVMPTDLWQPLERTLRPILARPAYPKLQVSPPLDLEQFRAREESEMNSYGWINRTAGVVRVPIDRAMELVLREGLPVRTNARDHLAGPSSYQLIQQRSQQRGPAGKEAR